MSVQEKNLTASQKKQLYREKIRKELGEVEYKKKEAEKKKQYRLKVKKIQEILTPTPTQPQILPPVPPQQINNKPINSFFKPITKEQYLKQNEKALKQIVTTNPPEKKKEAIKKDVVQVIQPDVIKTSSTVQPLHVKYNNKKAEGGTYKQYLAKLRTVYKLMFEESINESIITELEKLMDGKVFNEGLINHLVFFKRIKFIIQLIKNKYTNKNTLSSYINAITSILSRIPHFENEYKIIAAVNIDLSKNYQRERDTNDAPDTVLENIISFDDAYINKIIKGITNLNEKALFASYTLIPPQRVKEFQLMKITNKKDFDKLDKKYNYIMFENNKPSLFVFYNHKTKKTYPEKKITIPDNLVKILDSYINGNNMVDGDYLFGRDSTDFKEHYVQSKFTELIQKVFEKYTGKKISVDLLRTSQSTHLDTQQMSVGARKDIAQQMGHQLSTHLQYSKNMGIQRLKKSGKEQVTTTIETPPAPQIRKNPPRGAKTKTNYIEI